MLQAMVPTKIKEALKPWQLEGLKQLWATIIVDHEAHIQEQQHRDLRRWCEGQKRPTAATEGHEGLGEAAESNPEPAGCILAHTMGAGKTLQVSCVLYFAAFWPSNNRTPRVHTRCAVTHIRLPLDGRCMRTLPTATEPALRALLLL